MIRRVLRSVAMKRLVHCLARPTGRRFLLTLIIGSALTILIWTFFLPDVERAKQCFHLNAAVGENIAYIKFFEDVMESRKKPTPGKSIFFHETSCSKDGLLHLNARQACAIESAALLNPNWDIFVLSASPVGLSNDTNSIPPIFRALQTYSNLYFRNINLWTYSANTPLEEWFLTDELFTSQFLNSHVSDFLRYVTLFKFGGTYLDLDVVVQKTFENITPNYAGAESGHAVAAGVLNFHHEGIGHEIADMCVREFYTSFNGRDWGNNGPGVITRVLQTICHVNEPSKMIPEQCSGFKVYPPKGFYAIPWQHWEMFFDPDKLNRTMELTKDSIVIHVWNKHSIKRKFKVNTKAAYGVVADMNCPRVYRSCGDYF